MLYQLNRKSEAELLFDSAKTILRSNSVAGLDNGLLSVSIEENTEEKWAVIVKFLSTLLNFCSASPKLEEGASGALKAKRKVRGEKFILER